MRLIDLPLQPEERSAAKTAAIASARTTGVCMSVLRMRGLRRMLALGTLKSSNALRSHTHLVRRARRHAVWQAARTGARHAGGAQSVARADEPREVRRV